MKRNINKLFLCIIILLISALFLSSAVLSSVRVVATDANTSVVTTTSIDVPITCSMSGTTSTAHTATLINGTYSGTDYASGIGLTNLKTFCNDSAGFTIYAIGYTNDEEGNNTLHWSGASSASDTTNDIDTGIYTSGATDSSWSMKLTSLGGTYTATVPNGTGNDTEDFTNWHEVPDEYEKVAYRSTSTDTEEGGVGSSVTITYDAYISATQVAGSYVGKVKYVLVHPSTITTPPAALQATACPVESICFASNALDVDGDMSSLGTDPTLNNASPTAGLISAESNADRTLVAPNFSRPGYGFAGWSTDFKATDSSIIYGPNETITTGDLSGNGMILYPVWVKSNGYLQTWAGCSSLTAAPTNGNRATLSSVTALMDARDNNIYTVARLADGSCWMVENLKLDDTATITVLNTRNPLHDANNDVILKTDYANEETNDHLAASTNTFCGVNSSACVDQTKLNTNNNNRSLAASYNGNGSTAYYQWYSYGNYYNWYSATAGNGLYTYNTNDNSTDGDLCPSGWKLPEGGRTTVNTSGDLYLLAKTLMGGTEPNANNTNGYGYYNGTVDEVDLGVMASRAIRTYPNNFVYSGYFSSSATSFRGTAGYYWTRTTNSGYGAYGLYFTSSRLNPGTSVYSKHFGLMIRCKKI